MFYRRPHRKAVSIKVAQPLESRHQEIRVDRLGRVGALSLAQGAWQQMGRNRQVFGGQDRQLHQKPLELFYEEKTYRNAGQVQENQANPRKWKFKFFE